MINKDDVVLDNCTPELKHKIISVNRGTTNEKRTRVLMAISEKEIDSDLQFTIDGETVTRETDDVVSRRIVDSSEFVECADMPKNQVEIRELSLKYTIPLCTNHELIVKGKDWESSRIFWLCYDADNNTSNSSSSNNPWASISPTTVSTTFEQKGYKGTITVKSWSAKAGNGSTYSHPDNTSSSYSFDAPNDKYGYLPVAVTVTNQTSDDFEVKVNTMLFSASAGQYNSEIKNVFHYCDTYTNVGSQSCNWKNIIKNGKSITMYGYVVIDNFRTPEYPNGVPVAGMMNQGNSYITVTTTYNSNSAIGTIYLKFQDTSDGVTLKEQ
jgi:hypothetical protein